MGLQAEMQALTPATKPPRLRRRTITLDDGHRVGVSVCGDGVPLVMVHGIVAEGMLYARTLRRLAGLGFRVFAVDSAGHGRTDGLGLAAWHWRSYVDLHQRVIDHLGIERAVLMGHSMGGRVVVDLASRRPERAIAVIPIDAAIGSGWDRLTTTFLWVPGLFPLGVGLLAADTAASAVRARRDMGSIARLAAPSIRDRIRSLPQLPAAFVATVTDGGSVHMLRRLADHRVPTIVIHGDRDLAIWYRFARSAAADAGATLVRIEGGRHSWLLEDADSLPTIIASLLDAQLGQALAQVSGSIDDLYRPDALARTLDRDRSQPYELVGAHRWRLEAGAG